MSFKYILFFALITTFFVGCEDAADDASLGALDGIVIDNQTQEPVAGVVISTNPPSQSVMTDEQGKFFIAELNAGDYVVTAKKFGYDNGIETVNIKRERNSNVIIQLTLDNVAGSSVSLSSPIPSNNIEMIDVNTTFRWKSEASSLDDLTYQLIIYSNNSSEPLIDVSEIADTFYTVDKLNYSSTHLWQVIAKKDEQEVGQSPIWSFKTIEMPGFPFLFVKGVKDKDIYMAESESDTPMLISNDTKQCLFPRRNVITNEILFSAVENSFSYLYLMDNDGTNVKKVSNLKIAGNHNEGIGFCWSPSGEEILFCQYDKLYKIRKDGTGLINISTAPVGRNYVFADWSGLAGKIVVQTRGVNIYDSEIYLMDPDGSNSVLIVDNADGRTEYPNFSVDGKKIVYTHDQNGVNDFGGRMLDSRVCIYDISSSEIVDLSKVEKPDGTNDLQPRFSADGSKLIFVNTSNTGVETGSVYVMDIDGRNRQLYFEDAEMPEWQ